MARREGLVINMVKASGGLDGFDELEKALTKRGLTKELAEISQAIDEAVAKESRPLSKRMLGTRLRLFYVENVLLIAEGEHPREEAGLESHLALAKAVGKKLRKASEADGAEAGPITAEDFVTTLGDLLRAGCLMIGHMDEKGLFALAIAGPECHKVTVRAKTLEEAITALLHEFQVATAHPA